MFNFNIVVADEMGEEKGEAQAQSSALPTTQPPTFIPTFQITNFSIQMRSIIEIGISIVHPTTLVSAKISSILTQYGSIVL